MRHGYVLKESIKRIAIVEFDPKDRDRIASGSMSIDGITEGICGVIYARANQAGAQMP